MSQFLEPAYGERSLGDVVPAVAASLGVADAVRPTRLALPEAPGYVVFLVDGLGETLLRRHPAEAPYLTSLLGGAEPGTAGVPSTTATSLASFGTALTPGGHGLVGYTARRPGSLKLLNHLQWSSKVDPLEWQPNPTAFSTLVAGGVSVTVVNKREFAGSGLTRAAHRGGEYVGADRPGERIAAAVNAATARPSLTYLYEGDLDFTGHAYGVASEQWRQQLTMVDAMAERLREALPDAVRMVVVADHGMVDSPAEARISVDDHPVLVDGVELIGGEARFRHVYCRQGAVSDVAATWTELLGDRAEVLTRDAAVGRGWFGPVAPTVAPRLGDVVVACRGDAAVLVPEAFPLESMMVGLHGSLTPDEMLIPILVD